MTGGAGRGRVPGVPAAAFLTASYQLRLPSPAWASSKPPRTSGSSSRNLLSQRNRMLLLTWFSSHQALTGIPLSTSALARSRHISTDSSTFKATSLDPTTGREIVSYLGAGLNALVFYQTL